MTGGGTKHRAAVPLFLFFTLLFTLRCDEGLREDELECERAAIHVEECCPAVARGNVFACEYEEAEACNPAIDPVLTAEEGRCLKETSCADLVASGTCAALTITPSAMGTASTGGSAGGSSKPSIDRRAIIAKRTVCK